MDSFQEIITGLNTWLVCLGAGAVLWLIRQVTPESIENKEWFSKILRVSPMIIGALLALIPDLRPVASSWVTSMIVGFIMGSIAQSVYDTLRDFAPKWLKRILGARAKRIAADAEIGLNSGGVRGED